MSLGSLRNPLKTPPQDNAVRAEVCLRDFPLPSEGPALFLVRHANGEHSEGLTYDCRQCGREVAAILKEKLNVGGTGRLGVRLK